MSFIDTLKRAADKARIPFHSITLDLVCRLEAEHDALRAFAEDILRHPGLTSDITLDYQNEAGRWLRRAYAEDQRRWLHYGIPSLNSTVQALVDVPDLAWGTL